MTTLLDHLRSLGFRTVSQNDGLGLLKDNDYLVRNRTYAELHDDGQFFLWLDIKTPLLSINVNTVGNETVCGMVDKIINNELK